MKILFFSTSDQGGAAIATKRLHEALIHQGYESIMFVKHKASNKESIIEYKKPHFFYSSLLVFFKKLFLAFFRLFIKKPPIEFDSDFYFYNRDETKNYIKSSHILKQLPFKPDIIIATWISEFINSKTLYKIKKQTQAKIFWYTLDMAPFTGGCHYAWDCKGYLSNCEDCPAIITKKDTQLAKNNLKIKNHFLNKAQLNIISANTWTYKQSKESKLFANKTIEQLFIGVDETIFKLGNKVESRKKLNLPVEKKIVFIGSANLTERRKGFQYIIDALNLLKNSVNLQDELIVMIAGKKELQLTEIPFKQYHIGYLTSDAELSVAYQAADVFVSASIEDSGPMMIHESVLCGTPVVSFNMGVAQDLIIPHRTGYLAELKNTVDLAEGIKYILSLDQNEMAEMNNNCRIIGLSKVSLSKQVEEFEKTFSNKYNIF